MITDIRIKAMVDCMKDGRGIIEEGREYVDTEPGKYLHVVVAARFQPDFSGVLRLEIAHAKSGFRTYQIVTPPPKHLLQNKESDGELCFGSPGIPISAVLGRNYRPVMGQRDSVTVKLFLDNKEIASKELPVRGILS